MTQICVIGKSRIARSLVACDPNILVLSARRLDFTEALKLATPLCNKFLITARDPLASHDYNLSLSHWVEDVMLQNGVSSARIFHCGSYSVGCATPNHYREEKHLLEQAAITGTLAGCVLRLPIILINDEHFRKTLSSITWGVQQGIIEGRLRVGVLSPTELLKHLQNLPSHLGAVEIMPAHICTLDQLITKFRTSPIAQDALDDRLQVLVDYTNRMRNGEDVITHYEAQARMARI